MLRPIHTLKPFSTNPCIHSHFCLLFLLLSYYFLLYSEDTVGKSAVIMAKDTKYIKWNGSSWVFQKKINDRVAKLLGQKSNVYNKSLQTASLKEAQGLRHHHIVYLKGLEDAENTNPNYADTLDKFRNMSREQLEQEHNRMFEHLSSQYAHLGHEQWEFLTEEEKKASGLPLAETDKEFIEYRVLSALLEKDTDFRPPDKFRLTLKVALDKHLEEIQDEITKKAVGKYRNSVRQFLAYLGQDDISVYVIERITVRDFITSSKKLYATATISNTLSCLAGIWNYARDAENLKTGNPFVEHRIAKKRAKRQKYYVAWKPKDLKKVLDQLETEDQLPVYIAWYTGSRLNEAYGVKPEDIRIDKESGVEYISFKEDFDGKTEATTRMVPIHPELKKKLEDFSGFKRTSPDAYGKVFGRAKRKAGFDDRKLAFHSIRVNVSSALDKLRTPVHIAAQIVGHKDKGDAMTYSYYSEGSGMKVLEEEVNKLPTL